MTYLGLRYYSSVQHQYANDSSMFCMKKMTEDSKT